MCLRLCLWVNKSENSQGLVRGPNACIADGLGVASALEHNGSSNPLARQSRQRVCVRYARPADSAHVLHERKHEDKTMAAAAAEVPLFSM